MAISIQSPLVVRDPSSGVLKSVLSSDSDPSGGGGVAATLGSITLSNIGGSGEISVKSSAADTAWIQPAATSIYTSDGSVNDRDILAASDGNGSLTITGFESIVLAFTSIGNADHAVRLQWDDAGVDFLDTTPNGSLTVDGDIVLDSYPSSRNNTGTDAIEEILYSSSAPGFFCSPRDKIFQGGIGIPLFAAEWTGQLYARTSTTPPQISAYDGSSWVLTN